MQQKEIQGAIVKITVKLVFIIYLDIQLNKGKKPLTEPPNKLLLDHPFKNGRQKYVFSFGIRLIASVQNGKSRSYQCSRQSTCPFVKALGNAKPIHTSQDIKG